MTTTTTRTTISTAKNEQTDLKNQEKLLREKIESLRAQIDFQRFESNHRVADLLTIELVRISSDLRHNLYLQERRKDLKIIAVLHAFRSLHLYSFKNHIY
jgi:hypothetical protein